MMLEGTVIDEAVGKFCECMGLVVLVKLKLTKLDLALDFLRPVFGLLLAIEMIADCGVAFDANDCSPLTCPILILAFLY
jgi:hypothetical protein